MEITPFEFHGKNVRTLTINGEPWFVAIDSCRLLGLANVTEAVRSLPDDQKSTFRINEGGPERVIINEKGFNRLILKSRVKTAIKVQEWLTDIVMPSIRKTGSYSIKPKSQIDLIIESAMVLKGIDERLTKIENIQKEAISNMAELPEPTVEIPERSLRSRINEYVNNYVQAKQVPHSHCWNNLYKEFNYLYNTNLRRRANTKGCSRLDIIAEDGKLEELYTICSKILPLS